MIRKAIDIKLSVKTELNEIFDFDFYVNYLNDQLREKETVKQKESPCTVEYFEDRLALHFLKSISNTNTFIKNNYISIIKQRVCC